MSKPGGSRQFWEHFLWRWIFALCSWHSPLHGEVTSLCVGALLELLSLWDCSVEIQRKQRSVQGLAVAPKTWTLLVSTCFPWWPACSLQKCIAALSRYLQPTKRHMKADQVTGASLSLRKDNYYKASTSPEKTSFKALASFQVTGDEIHGSSQSGRRSGDLSQLLQPLHQSCSSFLSKEIKSPLSVSLKRSLLSTLRHLFGIFSMQHHLGIIYASSIFNKQSMWYLSYIYSCKPILWLHL